MANKPYKPATQDELLKMFIIDVLRHDIEQVGSIVNLLNDDGCIGWRDQLKRDFTKQEVLRLLPDLVLEGYLDLYDYSEEERCLVPVGEVGHLPVRYESNAEKFWYLLTDKGKSLWESWVPPDECSA